MRRLLLAACLFILAPSSVHATEIVAGVHLIRGEFTPGIQPDGNSVIIRGTDGLIVVDTGRHPIHADLILDFAAAEKLPIRAVINTHWHLDHIGGNRLIRLQFPEVRIYASGALAGARKGFLPRYRSQLEDSITHTDDLEQKIMLKAEVDLIDAGDELMPTDVIAASRALSIAGRELRITLEENSVTAGDLWIHDPSTGVVIAGDLVTLPAPFLDTACPARWKSTLDRLAKMDFSLLIPGHGAPMTRQQFATYRRSFDSLLACAASDAKKETCVSNWITGVASLTPDENPRFMRGLMDYYVDLLRSDASEIAKRCGIK
ncbi:MAG: MBL fold metallo-hydrolase [Thermoanaerobaculia bacterium]|nr:MBL fold metallo-hydrolase [Thermoanaerobaculia bacterium]